MFPRHARGGGARGRRARVDVGARGVARARARHAVNLAGGLHHAMPGGGVGLLRLQRRGRRDPRAARRRAPSGSPTSTSTPTTATASQAVFWDDPRVLTVSVHESGHTLFPGHGPRARDRRAGRARARAVNVALPVGHAATPAGCGRSTRSCPPWCARSRRDVLVTPARLRRARAGPADEPAGVASTPSGAAAQLAARPRARGRRTAAGSRSAAAGTRSSTWCRASWTHLLGDRDAPPGRPGDAACPSEWRALVRERYGRLRRPTVMTDGARRARSAPWSAGYDPADDVDRAIRATRRGGLPAARPRPRRTTEPLAPSRVDVPSVPSSPRVPRATRLMPAPAGWVRGARRAPGGDAGRTTKSATHDATQPAACGSSPCRGRRGHARLEDDRVPAAALRRAARRSASGRSFRVPQDALDALPAHVARRRGASARLAADRLTSVTVRRVASGAARIA